MKPALVLAAAFACLAAVAAEPDTTLVNRALDAPPEFASEALVRIALQFRIEKTRRVELLTEAFRRAAGAGVPYKRRPAFRDDGGLSRYYGQVYSQKLDALSLQLQAVNALLPLDPRKARSLFEQISPPSIPQLKCDDFLVYDVTAYYETLGSLFSMGFDTKEIEDGDDVKFLDRHALTLTSPVQIGPVSRLLASAGLRDADFAALATALAGMMAGVRSDPRSFAASADSGREIALLASECRRRGVSPLPLLHAYRAFLVGGLSGARCQDGGLRESPPEPVAFFNETFAGPEVREIEDREIQPSGEEGKAGGFEACRDADCLSITQQYRTLIFTAEHRPYDEAGKSTAEWKVRLGEFLAALAAWNLKGDTSEAEHYRAKFGFYQELVTLVPAGPDRNRVAREAIRYFSQSRGRANSLPEWFYPINRMIALAGPDLLQELRQSSDPVIALFADLEKLSPRPPEALLPLL